MRGNESMRKSSDIMERMRKQISMSKEIVSTKDKEYGWYAGGSWEIVEQMATVDVILKLGLIPKDFIPYLKIYRAYLDQKRKAWFASVGSTEITKLGFILGIKDDQISATVK